MVSGPPGDAVPSAWSAAGTSGVDQSPLSGSSNRMALTSVRTRPRPREIFCLPSAVRPDARLSSVGGEIVHLGHFVRTRLSYRLSRPRPGCAAGRRGCRRQSWCHRPPGTGNTWAILRWAEAGRPVTSSPSNSMLAVLTASAGRR